VTFADLQRLARWAVRDLYLPGSEQDDLDQEAMVGLVEALNRHDPARGESLGGLVVMCARRRGIDAVKAANRVRYRQLTDAARGRADDEHEDALDGIADPRADVPTIAAHRAELARILGPGFTDRERRALIGHAIGMTLDELGGKTSDNALQRARRKLAA
jgi:DNA-directed RNA polymerase specialized sigma24 family protein